MKKHSFAGHLRDTTSILALSTAALLASSGVPAIAQATQGIYAGGSTLASLVFRQVFDCYSGATVGGDGVTFSTGLPGAGLLPTTCTVVSTVQGMVAGVGSGNGMRGYISNRPEQWYGGPNFRRPFSFTIATPFPAVQPPFVDSANATNFGSYPYPRLDISLSDAPLTIIWPATTLTTVPFSFSPATNWSTIGGAISQVTVNGTAVATYNPTAYGQPIQVPAFEVNVAIAVNTSGLTVNSAVTGAGTTPGTQANQGAAIQLTTAQMCAIFSGFVTDWSDTTPNKIPYLDSAGMIMLAAFNEANKDSSGVAQPYSATSKTIRVVYNSDESGETYILTNYLKAVCPLIDYNAGYISIFGATNLPSTSFQTLIDNVNAFRGSTTITSQWIGAIGSGGVAATIGTGAAQGGTIGYVGANFTKPYTQAVSGAGLTNVDAPYSAALQNEQLRIAGIYVPDNTTPSTLEFIAPTPAGALNAWTDTRLRVPATTWTWADFNIYNTVFGRVTQGGVSVTGKSVLPLTNRANAYPLSGTAFMFLYSCYSLPAGELPTDPVNRVTSLTNYLSWHYTASNPLLTRVIQNVGFNPVPASYATVIRNKYLSPSSAERIAIGGTAGTNCASASGAL
ncbi:substrate-binding domain-containing protein [Bradyrhizobium sp. 31Argb]|uniref:substrate-binding domain-containing protein n=2 Tax=unclassified Bradyrhizobium TaxID=2631580 RepID=UPI003749156D